MSTRQPDLLIKGGTVVDGTGRDRFVADIAISDGRVSEVRPTAADGSGGIDADAREVIDARGLVVTPGFVDVHTHYDGQATWDEVLNPSTGHGVTTIVAGNCGVGFAPVPKGREQWLIELMEGVEDIPGTALAEGIQWDWETFPEYLDALERRRHSIDIGSQIAHGAVRAFVMGERGARNQPATSDDIAAMGRIVQEAIEAGALGFSTSRTLGHRAIDGEPVPGTFAAEDELFGIGRAMARGGRGVFELAPMGAGGEDLIAPHKEVDWMCRLAAEIGMPVSFALLQVDAAPDLWRELMDASLAATERGAPVYPAGCRSAVRHARRPADAPRVQEASDLRQAGRHASVPGVGDATAQARGTARHPRRARPAGRSHGVVRRDDHRDSGAAAQGLRARQPAELRANPRPVGARDRNRMQDRSAGVALRPVARAGRARAVDAADLQLLRRQPRRRARDVHASGGCRRSRRRWRALRHDLRRVDPHVLVDALGARPHAWREAAARVGRQEADRRHGAALRARRSGRARSPARRPMSTSSISTT